MNDILKQLFNHHPYKQNELKELVFGDKNVAVMLSNGAIGVCSTLCHSFKHREDILGNPDFTNYEHRVLVNAWVNANSNYIYPIQGHSDIFDAFDFTEYSQVVMVGYFGSLAQKLQEQNVNLKVFDLDEHEKPVEPLQNLKATLEKADVVILTATSISNNTFNGLIDNVSSHGKIFILGPSTPITPFLFSLPTIAGLFGAQFQPFDYEVLNAISGGGGTRSFLNRMEKVFLFR